MKNIFIPILLMLAFASCAKLDLNPLSEGSSENWNNNETQLNLSLNDLYRSYLFTNETGLGLERMTDNWNQRQAMNAFPAGTITGEWSVAENTWLNSYKGISRANTILKDIQRLRANSVVPEKTLERFEGEARFMRAVLYADLIFLYGDVPFYKENLTIDAAFDVGRTDKNQILQEIYNDYDAAIVSLPESYASAELKRATKGAAMAFKARTALNMGDWQVAKDAAQDCMGLDVYELFPDYGEYFLSKTRNAGETIFAIPRSTALGEFWSAKNFYPRTAGGSSVAQPSWELFCAYPCTDGLPIDESGLYDPQEPFKNRDPRCTATIVEFGSEFLGYTYDPNPYATTVLSTATGTMVKNKDSRAVDQYASYNGLVLKKGVDNEWTDDEKADFDIILMRYADVLLMYAEAKIELNELDQSMLDAINQVRARAYKVDYKEIGAYPALTMASQNELRNLLRNERRIELAWENRRFYDIIRWKIAEKVITKPVYGMLDVNDLKAKVVDPGLWFFPGIPEIDEEWLPDFTKMYQSGLIKQLVTRGFDKSKHYLWPIPTKEILVNNNLKPNPGY
ncbi:RagB/SusD family nutrient uptake outer membrane protein [Niabella terrae]